VKTKIKLKGLSGSALSAAFCAALALAATGSLQATGISNNIWTSGSVSGNSGQFDSNNNVNGLGSPTAAGLPGGTQWTVFDNFTTPTAAAGYGWVVNQFDFTDFLVNAPTNGTANVKSITWSIWSGDPLNSTGTLWATGISTTPTIVGNANGTYTFTVSGLSVTLNANTKYYLGTTNSVNEDTGAFSNGLSTTLRRALANPPPAPEVGAANWEVSNGAINNSTKSWVAMTSLAPNASYTAFDIGGTLTPEPGTWTLLTLSIGGWYFVRRRWAT